MRHQTNANMGVDAPFLLFVLPTIVPETTQSVILTSLSESSARSRTVAPHSSRSLVSCRAKVFADKSKSVESKHFSNAVTVDSNHGAMWLRRVRSNETRACAPRRFWTR